VMHKRLTAKPAEETAQQARTARVGAPGLLF
jgi:hypothetical protein